ncbi:hypothetical protein FB563_7710 [Streptomyces puniciscabiei]|uniref:Uncharacterized protein n=1 Tax=Streptomyces puniciscabiei TaxID=164348 RepID=A0A542SZ12_9ACTN|nr:hypothetical protein [Streptomyces puniciscabiei]TQK79855.1 hypothetical protein FB563_7710 [Streptomyces puniciscabiei]
MDITVQWVRTFWTKRSRGGTAAARRNGVPVGFPLPEVPLDRAHLVRVTERKDFTPEESRMDLNGIPMSLRERDGTLRVFAHCGPLSGLPPRPRRPPAVRLRPGQWVRWQLNHRYSSAAGTADWSYWLDTFNVAYGPVGHEVFLGEPTVLVDECGPVR